MSNNDLPCEIVKQIATPSYVFDRDAFRQRAIETRMKVGDRISLCYSIKANPFLIDGFFQPTSLFDKFEVCSLGELHICLKSGIPASMILFSGVNKYESEIEEAYSSGVRLFTIESYSHLKSICSVGNKNNETIPVLIRISADSQFGMDESDVLAIIKDRLSYPRIDILGIHYFTGTQKKGYSLIQKELEYLTSFCTDVNEQYGFEIKNVEYGLGLDVEYFVDQKPSAVSIDDVLPSLNKVSSITHLTIEMGRYFAGTCGHYYTKVVDCKTNNGTKYAIVDGGMNQLHYDGQVKSMKVPLNSHIRSNEASGETSLDHWTICGSICSTEDVICRDVEYENLIEEDILVFNNCGAYSFMEAMSTFLSREMPQIWAYSSSNGLVLLRDFILTDSFNCRME